MADKNYVADQFPKRQEGKLNIYFHVSENSGVGYYRQFLPAETLKNSGLANVLVSDFRWGEGNHVEPDNSLLFQIANWADIVIVGRKDLPDFYATWGGIREFFNIPIVLDTDDNIHHVRPTNPGYSSYHPGSEHITWNKYASVKIFDAITVSTQDLLDFHKKDNPRIYLLPNNLDVKEWDSHEKKKHEDGMLRIGFIGSSAHGEGVNFIKNPMLKIMQKYPKVKFMVTHVYSSFFKDWPDDIRARIEFVPWIKLQDWPKGVKELGMDIGLAPLTDNMFNRGKSNLRWMEYSASSICPIVSPVKPYLCVKDGVTGLIAKEREDWFKAMENLIDNEKLRYNITKASYEEIKTKYDIAKNIPLWEKTYREIHDKFHQFFGAKKEFIKLNQKGKYKEIKTPR